MIIEKCGAEQAEAVKKIINKMWPSKSLEEVRNSLQSQNEVIFVAKIDGEIIGFVHGIIRNDYMEGVSKYPALYIEGIFTEEKYRNQNIAGSLAEKLIEYGKEKNIEEIASECRENNIQSYNWHIKNNFDVSGKIVHFVKNINAKK